LCVPLKNVIKLIFVLGILVIISLLFCTPYFYYIPKSALAAIIIAAVIFMVEIRVVKPIYRSKSKNYKHRVYSFYNRFLILILSLFAVYCAFPLHMNIMFQNSIFTRIAFDVKTLYLLLQYETKKHIVKLRMNYDRQLK